jgi:hypothetical protein
MFIKAVWLLYEWPHRFIGVCESQKLFSSALLQDLEEAPFWYWQVVIERLYHPDKLVTTEEILEAIDLMERHGMPVSEFSLSRILGVSQVFRKRMMNFE